MSSRALTAFLKDIPEPKKSQFKQLDAFIRKHAPKLKPYLEGKFLGYGKYHYRYASGREGEWFTVGLGNNKNSLAVYSCVMHDGQYLAEKYADQFQAKVGRSCINFKKFEDINWDVLQKILEESNRLYQPKQISD